MTCSISVLVLTHNEEVNLHALFESVQGWVMAVYVIDSGSTDRTVEIAESHGAVVKYHPWRTYADQFNWGLDNMPISTEWVLRLDADERVTPELAEELQRTLPGLPPDVTGMYVKYRNYFLGRWIRYGGIYPIWLMRVFRYGRARCENLWMDEHTVLLEGRAGKLTHDLIHHSFKDLNFFTLKHNSYASREALDMIGQSQHEDGHKISANLFGAQNERKRWLKGNIYKRSPLFLRAFLFFVYRYFFLWGFLDGSQGLIFHVLQGFWYRFYVDAKIWEMSYRQRVEATDKTPVEKR